MKEFILYHMFCNMLYNIWCYLQCATCWVVCWRFGLPYFRFGIGNNRFRICLTFSCFGIVNSGFGFHIYFCWLCGCQSPVFTFEFNNNEFVIFLQYFGFGVRKTMSPGVRWAFFPSLWLLCNSYSFLHYTLHSIDVVTLPWKNCVTSSINVPLLSKCILGLFREKFVQ